MLPFRIAGSGALPIIRCTRTPPRPPLLRLRPRLVQRRCYAQPQSLPQRGRPRDEEALQRQAKAATQSKSRCQIPERLIIYHAGTGRTVFLAMLKLTSLLLGAFFCVVVAPSYVKSDKPVAETAGVVLCGIVPLAFVAYTTAPFVTHIHIHLPPAARTSRTVLERFVATMPPATPLTLTTMSFVAKPRYSNLRVADLRAAHPRRRFGLINYVRDTTAENAARAWYNLPAVGKFCVQDADGSAAGRQQRKQQEQKRNGVVETWIWNAVRDKIATRPPN